jgi:type II secretory pathway pseudopilin PulG
LNFLDPDVRQSIAALLILAMLAALVAIVVKYRSRQRLEREKRRRDY